MTQHNRRQSDHQVLHYELSMLNVALTQLTLLESMDQAQKQQTLQELSHYYEQELDDGIKRIASKCTPTQILHFKHKLDTFVEFYGRTIIQQRTQ